jgi:hypothetical protein
MSVLPPAAKGTTNVIGFEGQLLVWALALNIKNTKLKIEIKKLKIFMDSSILYKFMMFNVVHHLFLSR